ncbi:MAG TPA: YdcF family protein [Gemmatimonadaceae bacterium]|nr:YdcF family protein [Gemmatimonadaceae bacterium]
MRPRQRLRRWILSLSVAFVPALWTALVAAVILYGRRDEARDAGTIVVLGAAQYVGRPSPVLRARLDHAVNLWERGLADRLVLTGGTGMGDTTSEAAVGRRYVLQRGVPDSVILLENKGMTTSQSLRGVASLLAGHDDKRVILVSDPFHMLRLSILARQMGLEPYPSPTRTSPISANALERWKYVTSESLKVPVAYLLGPGGS